MTCCFCDYSHSLDFRSWLPHSRESYYTGHSQSHTSLVKVKGEKNVARFILTMYLVFFYLSRETVIWVLSQNNVITLFFFCIFEIFSFKFFMPHLREHRFPNFTESAFSIRFSWTKVQVQPYKESKNFYCQQFWQNVNLGKHSFKETKQQCPLFRIMDIKFCLIKFWQMELYEIE